jgi:hypothetical protein
VSLNSSTELAVVAVDGRLFHSRMDLGEKGVSVDILVLESDGTDLYSIQILDETKTIHSCFMRM